jgi:hypothetical protein
MIDPYGLNPEHTRQPVLPIFLDGKLLGCGCDACVLVRQAWTDAQPPLIGELDERDSEDKDNGDKDQNVPTTHDIGHQ